MLVIFLIPLLKVIKSIMNLGQYAFNNAFIYAITHLVIIPLMLVLQYPPTCHMSMEVSMTT